jgi:hypothetical protein
MKTNKIAKRSCCISSAVGALCMLLSCSGNQPYIAGSVTEGGNVQGRIADDSGTLASSVDVYLIPADYDPVRDPPVPDSLKDTTDEQGFYSFVNVKEGLYNVYAKHLRSPACGLITGITVSRQETTFVTQATVRVPGVIKVFLPDSIDPGIGYVFVPGTPIFTFTTPGKSFAVIGSGPAGLVPALVYAETASPVRKVIRYDVPVPSADTVVVTMPAWQHARQLGLNTTSSGADVAGSVTHFPAIIRLTKNNFQFVQTLKNGEDVIFKKADGSDIPFEIERWDSAGSQAEIWVKLDTVYGNDDAQYFTMYWGNRNASAASSGWTVFDTADGFQGVWHLGEAAGLPVKDATANHYDGTPSSTSPVSVPGAVGAAQEFDGAATFLTMSGTATGKLDYQEYGSYTVSAWVLTDTLRSGNDSLRQYIVSKGNPEYTLQMNITKGWDFGEYVNATKWNYVASAGAARVWSYVVGVRSGTSIYLFVNGVLTDSSVKFATTGIARNTGVDLVIGRHAGAVYNSYFDGRIDEVRIASVACSADWIKLCYMNQKPINSLIVFK